MLSRRFLSWLFALALLFGQAAAFAHALTHLHSHDTVLSDKVCETCIAQAQLGTTLLPGLIVLAVPPGNGIIPSCATPLRVDLAPRSACARAPPAPLNI